MIYYILVVVLLGTFDILQMKAENQKKEIKVYVILMLLAGLFGIFYFLNPQRTSFSRALLSLIGIKE
mgnify:CR=1 FL=1